jgi:hypothetical protein
MEIYGEQVRDLLAAGQGEALERRVREHPMHTEHGKHVRPHRFSATKLWVADGGRWEC